MPTGDKLDYPYVLIPVFPRGSSYYQERPTTYQFDWQNAAPIKVEQPKMLGAGWPEAGGVFACCGGYNTYYVAMCSTCMRRRGLIW